ncbi:MAG: phenylacetate--CoA ligase family protein [Deltaproteobacteria bacterium]|nr:phenylacetate--CoA ligase family protein [Deltaproteobacteria bacterium]
MNRLQVAIYGALPVPMQNLLCTIDGYRRSRHRFTPHFDSTLADWEKTSDDPIELHHARQWEALVQLIERARSQTRYYRFLPDPVEASDPTTALEKTLQEIPVLEKSVYRARTADFLAADIRRSEYIERSTSGTTGTALRIFDSKERFAENYAAVWRQRRSFGVTLEDPFLAFTGQITTPLAQRKPPFWRLDRHSSRALFSIYHMSPENLSAYIDPIHDLPASYVEGYPSALHIVSRAMIEANRCLPEGRLKAIFTSSESLLSHQRAAIETAFAAPVRDHYAATEHVVSMTACAENRLHVDMEFGIVEVEPREETEEWVRGPLVVTGLGRPAAPMIRYRIGDVGTRSKRPCPCGRPGDVFLDIDGRIEDYIVTPDGRLVGRMDHVFKGRYDIAEAQIVQDEIDALRVLVVPANDWKEGSAQGLERALHDRLGMRMRVEIQLTDQIEREPNGKLRAVKSRVHDEVRA